MTDNSPASWYWQINFQPLAVFSMLSECMWKQIHGRLVQMSKPLDHRACPMTIGRPARIIYAAGIARLMKLLRRVINNWFDFALHRRNVWRSLLGAFSVYTGGCGLDSRPSRLYIFSRTLVTQQQRGTLLQGGNALKQKLYLYKKVVPLYGVSPYCLFPGCIEKLNLGVIPG